MSFILEAIRSPAAVKKGKEVTRKTTGVCTSQPRKEMRGEAQFFICRKSFRLDPAHGSRWTDI
jgi:hypothetical protein